MVVGPCCDCGESSVSARNRRQSKTMEISTVRLNGDILRVTLNGSLDIAGAGEAEPKFKQICADELRVIINMAGVDFMASIGVRVLVMSAKQIGNRGGRLALYGCTPDVAGILKSVGVDTILFMKDSEEEAIETVQ